MTKTSKDFFIFRLRDQPSDYWMNRFDDPKYKNQVWEKMYKAAEKYNEFYNQLLVKATGKDSRQFREIYCYGEEAAKEQMHEDAGIWTAKEAKGLRIVIPKHQTEIIKWVEENWDDYPLTKLKRLPDIWLTWATETPKTFWRDKGSMDEVIAKLNTDKNI